MRYPRQFLTFPALALALFLLAGCKSENLVTVNGKLTVPGKLKLEETDSIVITFSPDGGAADARGGTATASAKDLSFSLQIPPGKYSVAVTFQPYAGTKDADKRARELSQIVGMYGVGATALRYEATADPVQNITIDLAKGTVNKN